ncbi:MAG: heme-binding beta-barrel domain-containing protein [Candidatus Nanopelagicales bacterium]
MSEPDVLAGVHPDIAHLSWLVGRWRGIGEGAIAGAPGFRYEEVVEFASDGRPFLEYRSVSWMVDEDDQRLRPSHTESGYWRAGPNNGVEVTICNYHGIAEIWLGKVTVTSLENARITGAKLEVHASNFVHTPGAPRIESGKRIYGLVAGELLMAFDMAAAGAAEESHVWIRLQSA